MTFDIRDTGGSGTIVRGPSVASDLTAVDVEDLAGNERRGLEVEDAVDDVGDLPYVPHWWELRAEPGVALRWMHRRLDDARRDSVHSDAAGGVLDGQRFRG